MDKLPWYGQIATFLVVAVAGFVVFHVYWVIPVTDEMSLVEEELAELRLEINAALQTASDLRQVESEVEDLTGRLESLSAALPAERDASALLRQVQTLAMVGQGLARPHRTVTFWRGPML